MAKHESEFTGGTNVYLGNEFRMAIYDQEAILNAFGAVNDEVPLYDSRVEPALPNFVIALGHNKIARGWNNPLEDRSGIHTLMELPDRQVDHQRFMDRINERIVRDFGGQTFQARQPFENGPIIYFLKQDQAMIGARFDGPRHFALWANARENNTFKNKAHNAQTLDVFFRASLSIAETFSDARDHFGPPREIVVSWPEPPTESFPVQPLVIESVAAQIEHDPENLPTTIAETPELPQDPFDAIGGLTDAKRRIMQIAKVFKYPDLAEELDIQAGYFLLYGPPGTGKTSLIKAFAAATDSELRKIKSTDIIHSHLGQSASNITEAIRMAIHDSHSHRLVLQLDEIDSLISKKDTNVRDYIQLNNIIKELLDEAADPVTGSRDLIIAGATNKQLSELDEAAVQRFESIAAPPPNEQELAEIWWTLTQQMLSHKATESQQTTDDLEYIPVYDTWGLARGMWRSENGFTGRDVKNIIKAARMTKFIHLVDMQEDGRGHEINTDLDTKIITQQDLERAIREYTRK